MFAAVERLSRVVGSAFTKSKIHEALLKTNLDENAAVNFLFDSDKEITSFYPSLAVEEDLSHTLRNFDYRQSFHDKGKSSSDFILSDSDTSEDEVVIVDAWPKKLGELTLNGFLTVNCKAPLAVGSLVRLEATTPLVTGLPANSAKNRRNDKGRGIIRIYLKDLEIGRVLGEVSRYLAPLLNAKLIRVCGRVLSVSSSLRRNEHLTIRTLIYVYRDAFDNQLSNDIADLQQCFIELLSTLGLYSFGESPIFHIPSQPHLESLTLLPLHKKGWITQLRPYQEFAVKWMINRESSDSQQAVLDPLWEQVKTAEGFSFFINRTLSRVSLKRPLSNSIVRGGILADEMGLGKTVESIALIAESLPSREERRRQQMNGTLIVLPLSLLNQWLEELYTHVEEDTFEILSFYGSSKDQFHSNITDYDIVLTTYGTLCAEFREKRRATSPLYSAEWYRVILDEAHIIKDRNTQTAKACFALNSERRWLLTGTPIQNSLDDFFSFVHFLKVYPYSDYKFWVRHILKPHTYKPNSFERQKAEHAIQSLINSFLLRRTKNTCGEDGKPIVMLPERRVEVVRLEPFEEERRIYLSLYAHSKSTFELLMSENRLLANFATVLELILRLRQCCDHPDLVLNSSTVRLVDLSSADSFANAMQRIFSHSANSNFSQSPEYLSNVVDRLKETYLKGDNLECPICLDMVDDGVMFCSCGHVTCKECVLAMLNRRSSVPCPLCRIPVTKNGIVPLPMKNACPTSDNKGHCVWHKSSKLVTLVKELKAIERCRMGLGSYEGLESVGKTVVFSQWTRYLDIIESALRDNGLSYFRLDGRLSSKERSKTLSDFRLDQPDTAVGSADILLVSLKAGGVGLNLTTASQVFIVDPWWNPAIEEQAIDRVHRIGQTRTVIVKRLIIANSIEESLLQVQEKKKLVADSMLDSSTTTKTRRQVTVEDLTLLFRN